MSIDKADPTQNQNHHNFNSNNPNLNGHRSRDVTDSPVGSSPDGDHTQHNNGANVAAQEAQPKRKGGRKPVS